MNLVAALDAHRGDDMVQQLVIDDELDKRSWHKRLIEGRMNANQLLWWQVCPKADGSCPRAATPAPPTNGDGSTIREVPRTQIGEDHIQVVITTAIGQRRHRRLSIFP